MTENEKVVQAMLDQDWNANSIGRQMVVKAAMMGLEESDKREATLRDLLKQCAERIERLENLIFEHMSGDSKRGCEEGACCNRDGCEGMMQNHVENCACHINPPCAACVNAPLVCDTCGFEIPHDERTG